MDFEPSASGSVSKLYHGTLFQTNQPPVTNTKIGKREKKKPFHRILLLTLQLTYICSCLGCLESHLFFRSALLLQASFLSLCYSLFLLFSILLMEKTGNKQGSLKLSLSDKPMRWVGSRFMCFGTSFTISGANPSSRTFQIKNLNSVETGHQLAITEHNLKGIIIRNPSVPSGLTNL